MGNKKKGKAPKKHREVKPNGMTYAQVLAKQAFIRKAVEKAAADTTVQLQSDIHTQRAMWLMVVSIADAFGIGPKRMQRDFFPVFQKNTDDLLRMEEEGDVDYAYEKLRQRAEQVSGVKIEYLYEHEIAEARAAHERMLQAANPMNSGPDCCPNQNQGGQYETE